MSVLQRVKQDGHLQLLSAFHYSQISLRRTPLGLAPSVCLREMFVLQRVKQDRHLELLSAIHYSQISLRWTTLGPALSQRDVCLMESRIRRTPRVAFCLPLQSNLSKMDNFKGPALSVCLREMFVLQRVKQDRHLELLSAIHYSQISLRWTTLGPALSQRDVCLMESRIRRTPRVAFCLPLQSNLSKMDNFKGPALSVCLREMFVLQRVKQDGHLELLSAFHYSQISLRWTPLGPALSVRHREMFFLQRVKQDGHLELLSAFHYSQISTKERCPSFRELIRTHTLSCFLPSITVKSL